MDQLTDVSDSRNKGWCVHCGGSLWLEEATRDHVPTRGLLSPPYPENLPVVMVCKQCNSNFASDEEYLIAFLGSVLSGSTQPDPVRFPTAASILNHSPRLRDHINRSRAVQESPLSDGEILWNPEMDRIERVIVKNSRGHVLYEMGEPVFQEPFSIGIGPLSRLDVRQREQFEDIPTDSSWPEVGSRMMQRAIIIPSSGGLEVYPRSWQDVQDSVYRYAVSQTGRQILVRTVLYEYLATEVVWS